MSLPSTGFQATAVMGDRIVGAPDSDAKAAEIASLREEVERLQQHVRHLDKLAHQDTLVDLPNRRGFMRHLEKLVARVTRYGDGAALLFIDVDGLKLINDSFGHKAGDEALIHVAEALVEGVRKSDYVARLGGDEFAILLEHADPDGAAETADRLVSLIADGRFRYNGASLPLSVAIGISMIEPGDSCDAVMERADSSMYSKKVA